MSFNSFSLKDIVVGQAVDYVWEVTAKQIDQFALLSGDYNPLHVSTEYAVDNGYHDRVAHGFLFGAQLSGIIGMLLPGKRCLLLEEHLAFPSPIYPKDTILINCTVREIWEDLSLIELKVKAKKKMIDGREGQTVARGKGEINKLKDTLINHLNNNCSKINFIDINEHRVFPDVAMRDSDHLRRPGWTAEYARLLKQIIKDFE